MSMISVDIAARVLLEEAEDEEQLLLSATLVFVAAGAEEARLNRIEKRQPHRLYLRRSQLLPNPRGEIPWQRLYRSRDDRAFITTMGFDVATFDYILNAGFEHLWNSDPVPRTDVSTTGESRLGARSLDASGALGLVLHWLGSAMLETSFQQIFALTPTTVARYLRFARRLLVITLRRMPEASIQWPADEKMARYTELITARHNRLYGAFGSIDGLNLPVQVSDDPILFGDTS